MPKKTKYRVYWTIKLYKDIEAESVNQAVEMCNDNDCNDGTYIDDSYEIYRVTQPDRNDHDVNKPNLLGDNRQINLKIKE